MEEKTELESLIQLPEFLSVSNISSKFSFVTMEITFFCILRNDYPFPKIRGFIAIYFT